MNRNAMPNVLQIEGEETALVSFIDHGITVETVVDRGTVRLTVRVATGSHTWEWADFEFPIPERDGWDSDGNEEDDADNGDDETEEEEKEYGGI